MLGVRNIFLQTWKQNDAQPNVRAGLPRSSLRQPLSYTLNVYFLKSQLTATGRFAPLTKNLNSPTNYGNPF